MEKFDPKNDQYKEVADLPPEHQEKFMDVKSGGFVRRETIINKEQAEEMAHIEKEIEEASSETKIMSASEEKKNGVEKINEDILNLKDRFERSFGKSLSLGSWKDTPWIIKEIFKLYRVGKENGAKYHTYIRERNSGNDEITECYEFPNGVVFCKESIDTIGTSAYNDLYYFTDKEALK